MRHKLREELGSPVLGHNLHCLKGHARLTFVQENYRPGSVLDIGSGQGAFGIYLHRQGCDVTLVDILPIDPPPDPGIKVMRASVYELWLGSWQTILFMEIIEHLRFPALAMQRCYRILAPGGVILITTPWVDTWDKELDHIWRFDQIGVEELLEPYDSRVWIDDTFVYAVVEKPL